MTSHAKPGYADLAAVAATPAPTVPSVAATPAPTVPVVPASSVPSALTAAAVHAVAATTAAAVPAQLTQTAAKVQVRLGEILAAERLHWAELDPSLDEPLAALSDLLLANGKRIRPAYCYWGWVLGGGDPHDDTVWDAGCALETLHAFALVHDDFMDASPMRRGAPSVWKRFTQRHSDSRWHGDSRRFGDAIAVLVGDMAMVLADRGLGTAAAEARTVWDTLRSELNMGQYLDIVCSARGSVTEDEARRIVEHKTARYTVVRPLQLGAALVGQAALSGPLEQHGLPVGVAFQLRDDVLGAFGDADSTGKPVGDDLRQGKPTLLMSYARMSASRPQQALLNMAGTEMDDEALASLQQVIVDTGALARVERTIDELLVQALDAINALPPIPEAHSALTALAEYAARRES